MHAITLHDALPLQLIGIGLHTFCPSRVPPRYDTSTSSVLQLFDDDEPHAATSASTITRIMARVSARCNAPLGSIPGTPVRRPARARRRRSGSRRRTALRFAWIAAGPTHLPPAAMQRSCPHTAIGSLPAPRGVGCTAAFCSHAATTGDPPAHHAAPAAARDLRHARLLGRDAELVDENGRGRPDARIDRERAVVLRREALAVA
jgi:hypothetical protein